VSTSSAPAPFTKRSEPVRAALLVLGLVFALIAAWQIRVLILLTVLGGLLGIAATPAVDWMEKRKIKRGLGAPAVVLGTLAFIAGIGLWSAPTVVTQMNALRAQIPAALDKLDAYAERQHSAVLDALLPKPPVDTTAQNQAPVTASGRLGKAVRGQFSSLGGFVLTTVTSTLAIIGALIYVVFLTMYFAIEPAVYRRGVLLLIPPPSRLRAAVVFDAVTVTLRKWLGTQLIAMVVIGLVTTIALLVLGVKSAIPLGILAGILEFVPNIGPIMSALPALLIAFADSPQKALFVGIAYWAIQFLENNLLIPNLMRNELDLPPALTLLWQALMAIVFGLLGLFVAVPLLAAGFVVVRYLYVRGDVPPPHRPSGSRSIVPFPDEPAAT